MSFTSEHRCDVVAIVAAQDTLATQPVRELVQHFLEHLLTLCSRVVQLPEAVSGPLDRSNGPMRDGTLGNPLHMNHVPH